MLDNPPDTQPMASDHQNENCYCNIMQSQFPMYFCDKTETCLSALATETVTNCHCCDKVDDDLL